MEITNPFSILSELGQDSKTSVSIADNFDTFLTLLTTQLKHQDPLSPLDTNQFTQQLVQFTEVEQSVKLNNNLEALLQLAAANTITNIVGCIGKEVVTNGDSTELQGGLASWQYSIDQKSPSTTFTVVDENNIPVYSQTVATDAGTHDFTWNGQTDTGGQSPNGIYRLRIVASDGNGGTIKATTSSTGVVDGVDMSGNEPFLLVGNRQISLDDVASIKAVSS